MWVLMFVQWNIVQGQAVTTRIFLSCYKRLCCACIFQVGYFPHTYVNEDEWQPNIPVDCDLIAIWLILLMNIIIVQCKYTSI